MGKIITFLKGPGLILVLVVLGFVGAYFVRINREKSADDEKASKRNEVSAHLGAAKPEKREVAPGSPQLRETVAGNEIVPAARNLPGGEEPPKPAAPTIVQARKETAPAPAAPKLPKLIQAYGKPPVAPLSTEPPTLFAPSGTLVKCSLVLTVDSSSLETPVLATVTEDVWENKKLIIPAGSHVYAFASKGRVRDRIAVTGTWTLQLKDGKEYRFSGIALDRQVDTTHGGFGITDGSAGIRGQILETDEYADMKIFMATAIGAVSNNSLSTTNQGYGNSIDKSASNIPLQGSQAVLDRYARRIEESQEGDGTFVRVAAGTEFYIFTLNVVEPKLASVANLVQGGEPANSWQLSRAAYEAQRAEEAATRAAANPRSLVEAAMVQRDSALKEVKQYLDKKKANETPNTPAPVR